MRGGRCLASASPGTRAAIFQQLEALLRQRDDRIDAIGLLQQLRADQLLDVAAHLGVRRIGQQAERAEAVVTAADDLLARLSAQHAGHVRGAEALPDARDARQNLAREHDGIGGRFELVQAVVAAAAAVLLVADRRSTPTDAGGGSRCPLRSAPSGEAARGWRR